MVEKSRTGIVIVRPAEANDFVVTDINRAAERIEDVRRQDVIGRRLSEALPATRSWD